MAASKFLRGFDGTNESEVVHGYRVLELRAALTRAYRTDAHLVTYVIDGVLQQPRLNKAGLPYFARSVQVDVLFCDIDNAGHAGWDPALEKQALAQYETLDVLQTAGVYHTRRGRRVVQPLTQPLPVPRAESALVRWLASLELAGLEVDWACRDWTRHFRLPHVVRDGKPERARVLLLDRMEPVEVAVADGAEEELERVASPPPPAASGLRLVEPRGADLRVAEPCNPRYSRPDEEFGFAWTTKLEPEWMPAIERIALAVRAVPTEWHSLFLAIAGALLARGAEPEELPLLCRTISMATGADDRPEDRERIGRSTAERSVMGLPVAGMQTLRRRWPGVAAAFEPEAPLRFRELVVLLEAAGGSRELGRVLGVEREQVLGWLRGEPVPGELAAALRFFVTAPSVGGSRSR